MALEEANIQSILGHSRLGKMDECVETESSVSYCTVCLFANVFKCLTATMLCPFQGTSTFTFCGTFIIGHAWWLSWAVRQRILLVGLPCAALTWTSTAQR